MMGKVAFLAGAVLLMAAIKIIRLFLESVPRAFADTMQRKGLEDPGYKKNVQKLIERNRRFEEAKE